MINIRKQVLIAWTVVLALLPSIPLNAEEGVSNNNSNQVVVIVNGKALTNRDLAAMAHNLPRQATKEDVLRALIEQELLYQDALSKGYDKQPQVISALNNARREVLSNAIAGAILKSQPVTDAETHQLYQDKVANQKIKQYRIDGILVATEADAKDIIDQLKKGADFSTLAQSKSLDSDSRVRGGDLGWHTAIRMPKSFSDAVMTMQKGQYTLQPVQTQAGWYVIKLDDIRNEPVPSYDEIKPRLAAIIENGQINKYVEGLRQKAKIEIK